jgi:hypothetical protein
MHREGSDTALSALSWWVATDICLVQYKCTAACAVQQQLACETAEHNARASVAAVQLVDL